MKTVKDLFRVLCGNLIRNLFVCFFVLLLLFVSWLFRANALLPLGSGSVDIANNYDTLTLVF